MLTTILWIAGGLGVAGVLVAVLAPAFGQALLGFVLRNPLLTLACALGLAAGIYAGVQTARLGLAHTQLETAQAERDASQRYAKTLGEQITVQNQAVQRLQEASQRAGRALVAAQAAAELQRANTAREIDALKAAPVPQACPEAMDWLVDAVQPPPEVK